MGVGGERGLPSDRPVLCSRYAGCAEELLPAQSIFNPEDQDEFTEKLRIALSGRLASPDRSRLASTTENLERLVSAIESSVSGRRYRYLGRRRLPEQFVTRPSVNPVVHDALTKDNTNHGDRSMSVTSPSPASCWRAAQVFIARQDMKLARWNEKSLRRRKSPTSMLRSSVARGFMSR